MESKKLWKLLESIAVEAGKLSLEMRDSAIAISKEVAGESDDMKFVVSKADFEIQKLFLRKLLPYAGELGFVGEEEDDEIKDLLSHFVQPNQLRKDGYTVLIDPIDGTKRYLDGNSDEFAVSVCVYDGTDIVCGVMYYPSAKEILTVHKGEGVYVNSQRIELDTQINFETSQNIRISPTIENKSKSVARAKSARTFCSTVKDLVLGVVVAYAFAKKDLLDLGCGTLAYKEAGGLITDKAGNRLVLKDVLVGEGPLTKIQGEIMFTPNIEYLQDFVKEIS